MMAYNLGESLSVVTTVYVAILLPWAFLYYHDFISSRWLTIRRTFRNGILHVIVISIPMPYIVFYIYLQPRLEQPDYKEMYTAITALVFSLYHLLRTFVGLIQLYHFRKWAINTALAMESASYKCDLICEKPTSPDTTSVQNSSPFLTTFLNSLHCLSSITRKRSRHLPTVNDPYKHPSELQSDHTTEFDSGHTCSDGYNSNNLQCDRTRISLIVDRMRINNSVVDNELIDSSAPWLSLSHLGRLRPSRPEVTFVRWSVVYLAQFGRQWLHDSKPQPAVSDSWASRRFQFGSEVWATAASRMDVGCSSASSVPSRRPSCSNLSYTSFLSPEFWSTYHSSVEDQPYENKAFDKAKTLCPDHDDHVFKKDKVLKQCYLDGQGLPYDCPILLDSSKPVLSHGLFVPLIKETIAGIPSFLYDGIQSVSPEQLEWFAIFIWVKQWGGSRGSTSTARYSQQSMKGSRLPGSPSSIRSLGPSDTPVRILQDQIGFEEPPQLRSCTIPPLRCSFGYYLWDNRSILQVTARIDNWVTLCVGQQVAFLIQKEGDYGPSGQIFERAHADDAPEQNGTPQKGDDGQSTEVPRTPTRSDRIFEFHRELEVKRLRYQLADLRTRHAHLEQSLSFMGCIVECLRSGIAEHVYMEGKCDSDAWNPEIPFDTIVIDLSNELWTSLKTILRGENGALFHSTMQERLLWECQNAVYGMLQQHIMRSPRGVQRMLEAMMLFVMGFPSVHFEHRLDQSCGMDFKFRTLFKIWPTVAPQPLKVYVNVLESSAIAELRLRPEQGELSASPVPSTFRWQDWRDAFEGRLKGKSYWQKVHYMRKLRVHRTTEDISSGVIQCEYGPEGDRTVQLWKGWEPFRAGLTLYELRHSSLIIVGGEMPLDISYRNDPKTASSQGKAHKKASKIGLGAYNMAGAQALSDASLHLDAMLKLSSSLFETRRDVKRYNSLTNEIDDDEFSKQYISLSPEASRPASPPAMPVVTFNFVKPLLPHEVVDKAQRQDAEAMHELSKWLLHGTKGFRKNRNKALLLMERALVIGHDIEVARLFVKTILENVNTLNMSNGDEKQAYVDTEISRALKVVELLWHDIETRRKTDPGQRNIGKVGSNEDESEKRRMNLLIKLHIKLVNKRRTAEMMRGLAMKLITCSEEEEDIETAIVLFESAVLASCDLESMKELALMYGTRDVKFAAQLYYRAQYISEDIRTGKLPALANSRMSFDYPDYPTFDDVRTLLEQRAQTGHRGAKNILDEVGPGSDSDFVQVVVTDNMKGKVV